MKKIKAGDRSKTKSQLRGQVQAEVTKTSVYHKDGIADHLDPNPLDYVHDFLGNFANTPKLAKLDLTTREGALAALNIIDKAQERINSDLRTARALKAMLTTHQDREKE